MGADFIWARAEVTEPVEYWLDWFGELNDDQMIDFIDATDDTFFWRDCHTDESEAALCQSVAERLSTAISVCYDYDSNREMGWYIEDGRMFILTGGMTWGDDPTEAYADIWMFAELRDWRASAVCTSDDPNNHQGDTCPIHEGGN